MILNKDIAHKIVRDGDLDFSVQPTLELLEYLDEKGYLNTEALVSDFATLGVGDLVRVTDWGCQHTTYPEWVVKNVEDVNLIAMYAYGDSRPYNEYKKSDRNIYKILALDDDKTHAYIAKEEDTSRKFFHTYPCYVIGTAGIQKVQ